MGLFPKNTRTMKFSFVLSLVKITYIYDGYPIMYTAFSITHRKKNFCSDKVLMKAQSSTYNNLTANNQLQPHTFTLPLLPLPTYFYPHHDMTSGLLLLCHDTG